MGIFLFQLGLSNYDFDIFVLDNQAGEATQVKCQCTSWCDIPSLSFMVSLLHHLNCFQFNIVSGQANMQFVLGSNYVMFLVTFSQVFLLNTAIMRGSYQWHTNLIKYVQYQNSLLSNQQLLLAENQRLKQSLDIKINRIISRYLSIRTFILFVWLIFSIAALVITIIKSDELLKYQIAVITYFMVFADSFIICLMFIARFYSVVNNQMLQRKMDAKEFANLKFKFTLLVFCTFIEALLFALRNPQIIHNQVLNFQFMKPNCVYNNSRFKASTFMMILFQALCINLLPARQILMLYTYREEQSQIQRIQS